MTRIRARKTLASTRVQPLQKTEHRVTRNDATDPKFSLATKDKVQARAVH